MKRSGGLAALIGVLVLLCAVAAWQWYSHIGGSPAAPQPVQQIAAASPPASPAPAPTQSPTPSPSPSPTPVTYVIQAATTAAPAATATPYQPAAGPAASAIPTVAATLAPHVTAVKPIAEPPDAPPRILAMSISTPVAHSGEVVSGTVETSSNVASVQARIAGYSSTMRKVGVGKFALRYRVPKLPFFLHRTYTIEVIARNTRGDAVSSFLPITIR